MYPAAITQKEKQLARLDNEYISCCGKENLIKFPFFRQISFLGHLLDSACLEFPISPFYMRNSRNRLNFSVDRQSTFSNFFRMLKDEIY